METKPYSNEHSARVREPEEFINDSFRRKNIEDGIDIIIGKLKDGDGSMVVQSYRFDASKFTVAQAKKWLKDHEIDYILFEEAKKDRMNCYYMTKDTFGQTVKDVDVKKGIVAGYFSVFGNVDADNEIVMPGAFRKSLQENGPGSQKNRIFHLFQHDPNVVLGKPHVLIEDEKGLYFETKISQTTYGRDVLKLYEDGVLGEHSIGYRVIKSEMAEIEKGKQVRKLLELQLWEGSTVTWGANELALVTSVKGSLLNNNERIDFISRKITSIQKALKGNYTDETIQLLEIELKQLQQMLLSLIEAEPTKDVTQSDYKPMEKLTADEMFKILSNNLKL